MTEEETSRSSYALGRLARLCALPLVALLLAACGSGPRIAASDADYPVIRLGEQALTVEIALTPEEQARGLMHREGIAEGHGMLFVYQRPERLSFWMKNVDFPIDIGFFDSEGVLREVYPMYPNDTRARRSMAQDLLFALETRSGWFRDNGVRPGARLDMDSVRRAIEERYR